MHAVLSALTGCLALAAAAPADFGSHWHDGRAELDGYRLTVSRYGEDRRGTAVLIYVTEPFSESGRVKLDDPARHPGDAVDVLKLNLVRDFQTGIYDYNTMTSVFARSSDFSPMKVSFSSAEWCGHVYQEMLFHPDRVEGAYHSYFEGESGTLRLDAPRGGVIEDNLFILLRGLRGEYLAPGESKRVPFLPGAYVSRLAHRPPAWTTAEIRREHGTSETAVPAGSFTTWVYRVTLEGGREGEFHIETEYPHRIVRWSFSPDVVAELTGTLRTSYWTQNLEGNEILLEALGLGAEMPGAN